MAYLTKLFSDIKESVKHGYSHFVAIRRPPSDISDIEILSDFTIKEASITIGELKALMDKEF